jgi:hypothetical protein
MLGPTFPKIHPAFFAIGRGIARNPSSRFVHPCFPTNRVPKFLTVELYTKLNPLESLVFSLTRSFLHPYEATIGRMRQHETSQINIGILLQP